MSTSELVYLDTPVSESGSLAVSAATTESAIDVASETTGPTDTASAPWESLRYLNTNVFGGEQTLQKARVCHYVTAYGYGCLPQATTREACAWGALAGSRVTTAEAFTAAGFEALSQVTDASRNTAFGHQAAAFTDAPSNTALGAGALLKNTTGRQNTVIGDLALAQSQTGSGNTVTGYFAGHGVGTGERCTLTGHRCMESTALEPADRPAEVTDVAAYGAECLKDNVASANTAYGTRAGVGNQTGTELVLVGYEALAEALTAQACTAVGHQALKTAWGSNNTGVGARVMAGAPSLGDDNSGFGCEALFKNVGHRQTAAGYRCLYSLEQGLENTAMGHQAGAALQSGSGNVLLGADTAAVSSGSYHVAVGHRAGPTKPDLEATVCLGAGAQATESHQVVLGSVVHPVQVDDAPSDSVPSATLRLTVNGQRYRIALLPD